MVITGARNGGSEKECAGSGSAENDGAEKAGAGRPGSSKAEAGRAGASETGQAIERAANRHTAKSAANRHTAKRKAKPLRAKSSSLPSGKRFPGTSGTNRNRVRDLRVMRIRKWEHRVAIMVASMCRIAPIGRETRYPQHTWFLCRFFSASCNSAPARPVAAQLWRGGWDISGCDIATMLCSWFDHPARPKTEYARLMAADNR